MIVAAFDAFSLFLAFFRIDVLCVLIMTSLLLVPEWGKCLRKARQSRSKNVQLIAEQ